MWKLCGSYCNVQAKRALKQGASVERYESRPYLLLQLEQITWHGLSLQRHRFGLGYLPYYFFNISDLGATKKKKERKRDRGIKSRARKK
jgi:hypothetical protein